jgi:diadenosine tetraphosphatase ApaH/serine/threonine PP2A family protein phosphatase
MANDILILCGDLVDRGPGIYELINFVRYINNIYTVQGNHENKLVRWMRGNPVKVGEALQSTIDQLKPDLERPRHREELQKWFEELPHIIRFRDDAYVVHAGIDPRIPIEHQDSRVVIRVRSLDPIWVAEGDPTVPAMWYTNFVQGDRDPMIFFGHSVHEHAFTGTNAFSMDGGCVFGGELRGAEVHEDCLGVIKSVKAKKVYYGHERCGVDE